MRSFARASNDRTLCLTLRSMSFVLVTSCFAFYLLSFCYWLIDVKGWWSGAPFFYPGQYLKRNLHQQKPDFIERRFSC